jgi:Fe-S-cluster containining protein
MLAVMPLPARDVELVQIVDASLADAGRRAGEFLACRIGCTQCCSGAFAINALDAARLRAGMDELRLSDPGLAAAIERRARVWLEEFGDGFPGDQDTGALGTTETDRERFEEFANDAACPALDPTTGRCDVYAWRPMTCRVFGPPVRADWATASSASSAQQRNRLLPARCRCRMSSRQNSLRRWVLTPKPLWRSRSFHDDHIE